MKKHYGMDIYRARFLSEIEEDTDAAVSGRMHSAVAESGIVPLKPLPPTLADMILTETYIRNHAIMRLINAARTPLDLRTAMLRARRFKCDVAMSEFMCDLSAVPFHKIKTQLSRRLNTLHSLRHGARLPFPVTWVEYDGKAFRRRLQIAMEGEATDPWGMAVSSEHEAPHNIPETWGWLLETMPDMPTVVRQTPCTQVTDYGMAMPFQIYWNTVDEPLPPKYGGTPDGMLAAEIATGITGCRSPYIGLVYTETDPRDEEHINVLRDDGTYLGKVHFIIPEMAGTTRHALAFLATLNDVPVIKETVRPSRGHMVKGEYRRYLEHQTLNLNIPARVNRTRIIHKFIAAAKRRAHPVRGHWRLYDHDHKCPGHEWPAAEVVYDVHGGVIATRANCKHCKAWRTWIADHQRGDDRLAFVTHDYAVHHKERP